MIPRYFAKWNTEPLLFPTHIHPWGFLCYCRNQIEPHLLLLKAKTHREAFLDRSVPTWHLWKSFLPWRVKEMWKSIPFTKCQGLFLNCQNTKFSFVWCVSVWPGQKWDRFSQELVYVKVFSQIWTPNVFISHIGYLDFNILYFVNPEGALHHHLMWTICPV